MTPTPTRRRSKRHEKKVVSLTARAATYDSIDESHAEALRDEAAELEERIEASRERSDREKGVQKLVDALAAADADSPDLTDDEREEIRPLAARAETFDSIDESHAEALRAEAADIAGVDDFGEVEAEVL